MMATETHSYFYTVYVYFLLLPTQQLPTPPNSAVVTASNVHLTMFVFVAAVVTKQYHQYPNNYVE